mmetsp:Transcript_30420/g.26832  ORF Transcript_30420/g.26832 Transcript_30420/m.26832 type:complete len:360 (-) Transcript_30420:28-1107(-)
MGGKKKKGGKKGGTKKNAESAIEEVTLDQLQTAFKKECKSLNVPQNASQAINEIFQSYLEDEEKGTLSQLCIAAQINATAVEALFNSIYKSKYIKLKCICFWRANIGDDGAKAAGDIIANIPTIQKLEIRDSALSMIGCELLAKSILINNRTTKSLVTLRLDFNRIGSEGLLQIAHGLLHNRCIKRLSFSFCAIYGDKHSNDALHKILSNCFLLEELNLENNNLGTKGCIGLITGLQNIISTTLNEINISSNQIGQDLREGDVQILHGLAQQFKACKSLKKISFHGNFFGEKIADVFLMMLSGAEHISKFTVPHTLPPMVVTAFSKTLESHKGSTTKAKGKKGKAGKSKKSKKKSKKKK